MPTDWLFGISLNKGDVVYRYYGGKLASFEILNMESEDLFGPSRVSLLCLESDFKMYKTNQTYEEFDFMFSRFITKEQFLEKNKKHFKQDLKKLLNS